MSLEKLQQDLAAALEENEGLPVHDEVTPAEALEALVRLSMRRAHALLSADDLNDKGLIRTQAALINTFMTSAIRVQETILRQRKVDAIDRITKLMDEEREKQRRLGY